MDVNCYNAITVSFIEHQFLIGTVDLKKKTLYKLHHCILSQAFLRDQEVNA